MSQTIVCRQPRRPARLDADRVSCAPSRGPRVRRGMAWVAMSALALCGICGPAVGDDSESENSTADYYQGSGVLLRAAHNEGQGVPQILSITPIELFPYVIDDAQLIFSDLRFFPTNDLTLGGNAGFGYRYYSEGLDRVFGISGWYDGDNTRRVLFQQLGLSLESYAGPFDFRSNLYLPVGPTQRQTALSLIGNSTHFVGDNVVYDQFRSWYAAMKGFDMEAGIPIPGEFARDRGIRIYGGGYHFVDNQGDSITGGSARVQANLIAGLDAQVQVTYDNFFQTRAFVGISYTFGALHRSEMKQSTAYGRMGEHVTRNYTVVAEGHNQLEHLTAIDPATGSPYTFAHVSSSAAPGGNGTIASPFQTILAAQSANRDIIFVHAGSVFSGGPGIVLNAGERILGDGQSVQHFIRVPQLGSLLLPQSAGNLPVLNGSAGDAVVLANSTEFSGFSITNAAGNAIVGNGVQNVILNNIAVMNPGGDGIRLVNTAGPVSITNNFIAHSMGSGINIEGGSGLINFSGTTVSGASGAAVLINNLATAGTVTFDNLSIDHRHDLGLEIAGLAGTVNVTGTANISNEAGATKSALDIRNSSGNANFNQVNVSGATGAPGINLQNSTGTTSFSTLNISSQNGTALAANNGGTLVIDAAVNNVVNVNAGGNISAVNGTAVDIQGTALNVNLMSVSSSNAAKGISLVNTPGLFAIFGSGTIGSGGTIQNDATGIYLQNTGQAGFQWMNLNANGLGIHAQNVADLIVSNSAITNSTSFGIDALDTSSLSIANSTFSGNVGANLRAQFDQLGSYAYSITGTQFISGTSDNVVFNVLNGAQGATMNLTAQGNLYTNTLAGTAGLKVNWNGALSATVDQSTFNMNGGSNTGVFINNASTTALSTIVMTNSAFTSTGGSDTAFHLVTVGASQLFAADDQV
ncbi:MAG TPA: right-handed parallel beta-helix repeat-containing protein, partial [Planctomycetaceae bacterium]|nr:right-handed parallel beta-helix repeat-containing protein [Planctomycetaceae bacterium]